MLRRFLSCLKSRFHAHESPRRRAGVPASHPAGRAGPASVREDGPPWPACPVECPLCDKRCILARPRCKHGEAFIQFMRTHGGDPRTRTL